MRIPILTFGAIASILTINSVMADTTSTVTSRGYVDAAVATKQNKIGATGANFTNGSVVETTGTEGVVTQRGIFNYDTDYDWDNHTVEQGHEDDLVTAGLVVSKINEVYDALYDEVENMPTTTVAYKTCTEWSGTPHTDANCLLWSLGNKTVYGERQCTSDSDCSGACNFCNNGQCITDNDSEE